MIQHPGKLQESSGAIEVSDRLSMCTWSACAHGRWMQCNASATRDEIQSAGLPITITPVYFRCRNPDVSEGLALGKQPWQPTRRCTACSGLDSRTPRMGHTLYAHTLEWMLWHATLTPDAKHRTTTNYSTQLIFNFLQNPLIAILCNYTKWDSCQFWDENS